MKETSATAPSHKADVDRATIAVANAMKIIERPYAGQFAGK